MSTSIARAHGLLKLMADAGKPVGVSELSRRSGLAKTTTHRLLCALEAAGLVERCGTQYQTHARSRADVVLEQNRGLARSAEVRLGEAFLHSDRLTVHLAVLDGHDVVYVAKVAGRRTADLDTAVGDRMPATCSALGKALLAFSPPERLTTLLELDFTRRTHASITSIDRLIEDLSRTKRAGAGVDRGEAFPGIVCVAAPIIVQSRVVAAVSLAGPVTGSDMRARAALVKATARQISGDLDRLRPSATRRTGAE
jgi:DNA-binding IclR family transcriptional regulator